MKKRYFLYFLIFLSFFSLLLISCKKEKELVIKVGMECDYAPFNYIVDSSVKGSVKIKNYNGFVYGYDVLVAKYISKKLNYKLEIYQYKWDSLINALNTNEIDLVIAGMSKNKEREKNILFSNKYFNSTLGILSLVDNIELKDNRYTGVCQSGTIYQSTLDNLDNCKKSQSLDSIPAILTAISSDKDKKTFTIIEDSIAKCIIKQHSEYKFKPLENTDNQEISIGIKKNNNVLLEKINNSLKDFNKQEEFLDDAIDIFVKQKESKKSYVLKYFKGFLITILLALVGTVLGLFLAFFLSILRMQKIHKKDKSIIKILKYIAIYFSKFYITIIRGTPMLIQAMIFYWGFRFIGIKMSSILAAIITISLNSTAYLAEVLRGGIKSVDKGQIEASRSLGFNSIQTFFYVVLPQAIKNVFPSIGNEFIVNIKDSSVFNIIQVCELFFVAQMHANSTYNNVYPMLISGAIYLFITIICQFILNLIERKMHLPEVGIVSSN